MGFTIIGPAAVGTALTGLNVLHSLSSGPSLPSRVPLRAHWNWAAGLDSEEQDRVMSEPEL